MDSQRRKRNDEELSEDEPVYSRLFVVYDKKLTKDYLNEVFSQYGVVENIKIHVDFAGKPKGVCFIKFSKTSEAAYAMEIMHSKVLPGTYFPLKVSVAVRNYDIVKSDENDYDKYKRLFINVPRSMTENELESIFCKYGTLRGITIQRDHDSGESKGFGYVTFSKFSEAAQAFEECERMYRPVFAKPKKQKRPITSFEANIGALASSSLDTSPLIPMMGMQCQDNYGVYKRVNFICCPELQEWQLAKLFDLIPGMEDCRYIVDLLRNYGKGTVTYNNHTSAAYAVQKLNEFEFPPGVMMYVKPDNSYSYKDRMEPRDSPKALSALKTLKNAIEKSTNSGTPDLAELSAAVAEASKLIKMATTDTTDDKIPDSNDLNYCSVDLPPPQPLADIDSAVAKRCFLICKPSPPPLTVLRDIFCRFGNLINVYTLPNKVVGFARYASSSSADEAIKVLHGAEVCGVRMKVVEAEEEAPPKKRRFDNYD